MSLTFYSKKEAEEHIKNLEGNKTGIISFLNGKYIVEITDHSDIICPFCGEKGFDKIGLKDHIRNNRCAKFEDILTIEEESKLRKIKWNNKE